MLAPSSEAPCGFPWMDRDKRHRGACHHNLADLHSVDYREEASCWLLGQRSPGTGPGLAEGPLEE